MSPHHHGSRCAHAPRRSTSSEDSTPSARNWQNYAAAAGASLAMAVSADAAVQHTLPSSPIAVLLPNPSSGSRQYGLDLDRDSQVDFNFLVAASSTTTTTGYTSVVRRAQIGAAAAGNGVLGSNLLAWRLQSDSVISAGLFDTGQLQTGLLRRSTFSNSTSSEPLFESGEWGPVSSGYVGVKLVISTSDHFGWIKVATTSNANGLTGLEIHEWAYDDVPGGGILAGDSVGQLPPLPGDYDRSGEVDAQDYALWKNTFGSTVVPGSGADGNADAVVNSADYTVWRNHAENGSGTVSVAVPEPGTASLAVLALGAAGVAAVNRIWESS